MKSKTVLAGSLPEPSRRVVINESVHSQRSDDEAARHWSPFKELPDTFNIRAHGGNFVICVDEVSGPRADENL